MPAALAAHLAGAVFYGVRLGAFLYHRSVTWTEWNARAKNAPEAKASTAAQKLGVIAACSLLYAMMCSPMLWHAQVANVVPGALLPVTHVGLALQWSGALLESVADHQKSAHKKIVRERVRRRERDDERMVRRRDDATCRHPNYLGELVFWFGLFLAGVPAMATRGWWSFAPATLGLAFIAKLMTPQCAKQDEKQKARYEGDENHAGVDARERVVVSKAFQSVMRAVGTTRVRQTHESCFVYDRRTNTRMKREVFVQQCRLGDASRDG